MKEDTESGLAEKIGWVESWEDATKDARRESEIDRDYYDGIQWTSDEVAELEKRGQPVITINRIFSKINTILGQEVRTRVDPRAYPRTPKHEDGAIAVTDALRFVADKERFDTLRSLVAKNQFVEGYGGAVVEIEKGESSIDIKLRHVPWDRIVYDPHSRDPLFRDARYLGVVLWKDLDDAIRDYPDAKDILESATNDAGGTDADDTTDDRPRTWFNRKRNRVKLAEIYHREGHDWHVCVVTKAGYVVESKPTGYVDEDGKNECPLKLCSGFVTRDNRRYGLVRMLRSPQDEINKRRSKLLHQLTMRQFTYTPGAIKDPHETKLKLAQPDGDVEILDPGGFQLLDNVNQTMGQLQLLQEAKNEIDAIGPRTSALMAEGSTSGRHALAQQQAGSMELEPIFDHLRAWQITIFRSIWNRVRQYWPEEKWIRVRDDENRKGFRFVALNRRITRGQRAAELVQKGVPMQAAISQVGGEMAFAEASMMAQQQAQQAQQATPEQVEQYAFQLSLQHPLMAEVMTENDVAELDVDIILDAAPDTAVVEQEEFESLANMVQAGLPVPPDVIIQASQLRNKRELLDRLEQQNQPDPMAAQLQEMQMQIQQMQMAMQQAEIAKTQAETIEIQTEAEKNQAQAAKYAAEAGEKLASPMTLAPR